MHQEQNDMGPTFPQLDPAMLESMLSENASKPPQPENTQEIAASAAASNPQKEFAQKPDLEHLLYEVNDFIDAIEKKYPSRKDEANAVIDNLLETTEWPSGPRHIYELIENIKEQHPDWTDQQQYWFKNFEEFARHNNTESELKLRDLASFSVAESAESQATSSASATASASASGRSSAAGSAKANPVSADGFESVSPSFMMMNKVAEGTHESAEDRSLRTGGIDPTANDLGDSQHKNSFMGHTMFPDARVGATGNGVRVKNNKLAGNKGYNPLSDPVQAKHVQSAAGAGVQSLGDMATGLVSGVGGVAGGAVDGIFATAKKACDAFAQNRKIKSSSNSLANLHNLKMSSVESTSNIEDLLGKAADMAPGKERNKAVDEAMNQSSLLRQSLRTGVEKISLNDADPQVSGPKNNSEDLDALSENTGERLNEILEKSKSKFGNDKENFAKIEKEQSKIQEMIKAIMEMVKRIFNGFAGEKPAGPKP